MRRPPPRKTTQARVLRPGDESEPKIHWYGWQIAISDAAAAGLIAWGLAADVDGPLYVGLGTYLFIPPFIHGLHDRDGALLASLGVRLALPVLAFGTTCS